MERSDNKIYLLTTTFPYGYKEQFLEHEIVYWKDKNLIVFPMIKDDQYRFYDYINVDDAFNVSRTEKISEEKIGLVDVFDLMFDTAFWYEFFTRGWRKGVKSIRMLLIDTFLSNRLCRKIITNKHLFDENTVVYSYWSNWILRGAAMAKARSSALNFILVARAHRIDLYEYAKVGNYMPYRHSFFPYVDHYFSISDDGKQYLVEHYGIPESKVSVSRLGVPSRPLVSSRVRSSNNELNLLSVSYAKKVKRLDRIIDAMAMIKKDGRDLSVSWTHIGDGPELESLKNYAMQNNIDVTWKGLLSNGEVLDFLAKCENTVFINVSDSEGVPVSIMEAMSFGLPVIATDVGGTREIVDFKVGQLITEPFTPDKIASSIMYVLENMPEPSAIKEEFDRRCSTKSLEKFVGYLQKAVRHGSEVL